MSMQIVTAGYDNLYRCQPWGERAADLAPLTKYSSLAEWTQAFGAVGLPDSGSAESMVIFFWQLRPLSPEVRLGFRSEGSRLDVESSGRTFDLGSGQSVLPTAW